MGCLVGEILKIKLAGIGRNIGEREWKGGGASGAEREDVGGETEYV